MSEDIRRRVGGRWLNRCWCGRWKVERAARCSECYRNPVTGRFEAKP